MQRSLLLPLAVLGLALGSGAGAAPPSRPRPPRRHPDEAGLRRLIRGREDHGVVFLLDDRIVRTSYGRCFTDSHPPAPLGEGPWRVVKDAILARYGEWMPARRTA